MQKAFSLKSEYFIKKNGIKKNEKIISASLGHIVMIVLSFRVAHIPIF